MKKNLYKLCAALAFTIAVACAANAQEGNNKKNIPDPKPQVSVVPKLALKGAVSHEQNGKQYHKIILTVENRNKLSAKMFELGAGEKLPPNPCGEKAKTRVVMSVFSERGKQLAACLAMRSREALAAPSFLIEKGVTVPEFVYIILTDLKTGASYKSNLVSPFGGETK